MNQTEREALLADGEKAERALARRHLIDYACYMAPWYIPAPHIVLLAQYLEKVELFIRTEGKEGIGRLMVFMPPRYGKSETISRLFPSWVLGKNPDKRVIQTSYGADLAQDDSRKVREYLTSPRFMNIFGKNACSVDGAVEISIDSRSQAHWDLAAPHRGGLVAAGIGGGITGKGANLLNIDDPIKSRDEADSEAYLKTLMSWYRSTAYSRLEKGGAIVITHTRWSLDDLAGQLLQAMGSDSELVDKYEILFLPAIALDEDQYARDEAQQKEEMLKGIFLPIGGDMLGRKAGEALWPDKASTDQLKATRENVTDLEWWPVYQQLPQPITGGFFQDGDFIVVDEAPKGLKWYRYMDLAIGRTSRSDFNSTVAIAHDPNTGFIYLRDMIRIRELNEFLATVKEWMLSPGEKGTIWAVEDVAFQTVVFNDFMKDKDLINTAITQIRPEGDKVTRARPLQTRCRQGFVMVVDAPWVRGFLQEAFRFGPNARKDDQIDTASGGMKAILDNARIPAPAEMIGFA
ncbi:MAG: hypothetical protein C0391_03865 [Anaerolinea sp.]|nr:hypothetical protein [Anaerolinea sp.]